MSATIHSLETLRQKWVKRISLSWQGGVESIIDTGKNLIAAKDELSHGEWLPMIEKDLPFGRQTAFCLMKIADDSRISNVKHALHLPPSWSTLYELTKLNDNTFYAGIKDRTINPEMERSQVSAMKPVKKTNPTNKTSKKKNTADVEEKAARLVLDEGKTLEEAAQETNVGSVQVVKTAVAREEGKRTAEAKIDPTSLSLTAHSPSFEGTE